MRTIMKVCACADVRTYVRACAHQVHVARLVYQQHRRRRVRFIAASRPGRAAWGRDRAEPPAKAVVLQGIVCTATANTRSRGGRARRCGFGPQRGEARLPDRTAHTGRRCEDAAHEQVEFNVCTNASPSCKHRRSSIKGSMRRECLSRPDRTRIGWVLFRNGRHRAMASLWARLGSAARPAAWSRPLPRGASLPERESRFSKGGVQWKQGVVASVMLCTASLENAAPNHCTPLPLHPTLLNTQRAGSGPQGVPRRRGRESRADVGTRMARHRPGAGRN